MLRVLIVDDSALMRRKLTTIFEEAGGFEILQARNGSEAVTMNREVEPDVVTLDINMPEVDGLTALTMLMAERPVPVVMFSSLTVRSALPTFEALALGAVDYVAKPGGTISLDIGTVAKELVTKVRTAARARLKTRTPSPVAKPPVVAAKPTPRLVSSTTRQPGLVLIGVSTGGPRTLEDVLPYLPAEFPWPVLVAQHMPASFTAAFAQRLNGLCRLPVEEVSRAQELLPGRIYIGRGDADLLVSQRGGQKVALCRPEQAEFLWHPSVELLGRSALEHYPASALIGVMLTGMGHDGAAAFTEILRRGGRTIAESQESAVVFGMPAKLIEAGGAGLVLPADRIAQQLMEWTR